jgi:hypothetical protein
VKRPERADEWRWEWKGEGSLEVKDRQ